MNQYPAKPFMDQMAQHGRYGDSMLVHMNPVEVQGIAALSPTGSLTTNPITGQPEAFLPFLAPVLGSLFGSSLLSGVGAGVLGATGLSSAAAGAIGSGLATTLATGDIKKGLLSGITGFGLGQALGAASDALNPAIANTSAALDASTLAATEAGANVATAGADAAIAGADVTSAFATPDIGGLPTDALGNQMSSVPPRYSPDLPFSPSPAALDPSIRASNVALNTQSEALKAQGIADQRVSALKSDLGDLRGQQSFGDRLTAPFKEPGAFGKRLLKPSTLTAVGVGEGQKAALTAQEEFEERNRDFEREREEDYRRNVGIMNSAYDRLEQDYPGYTIPRRAGGVTSIDPAHYGRSLNGLQDMINAQSVVRMNDGGDTELNHNQFRGSRPGMPGNFGDIIDTISAEIDMEQSEDMLAGALEFSDSGSSGGGADGSAVQRGAAAAARQAGIRPSQVISREELRGFRPGFDSEISYYKAPPPPPPGDGMFPPGEHPPLDEGDLPPDGAEGGEGSSGGGPGRDDIPHTGNNSQSHALAERAILETNNPVGAVTPPLSAPVNEGGITDIVSEELTPEQQAEINILREVINSTGSVPQLNHNQFRGSRPGMPPRVRRAAEGGGTNLAMNDTMEANGQLLIERAVMAISGRLAEDEAEVVIAAFVDEFGPEAFQMLREKVLQEIVPNAQTEGEIVGSGGGMDDLIPGMIGADQPVAVSPGEYIVPADVVSGIGDGSTDSGVQELDGMLDRVRMERTGTIRQPQPMRSGGVMPG